MNTGASETMTALQAVSVHRAWSSTHAQSCLDLCVNCYHHTIVELPSLRTDSSGWNLGSLCGRRHNGPTSTVTSLVQRSLSTLLSRFTM